MAELDGFKRLAEPQPFDFIWAPGHIERQMGDWQDAEGNVMSLVCLPDYLKNGDAARAVFHKLRPDQQRDALEWLMVDDDDRPMTVNLIRMFTVSASEVTKAILHATGKWKD